MTFLRLGTCVIGVYSMFLLWAIAQERLSVPFATLDGTKADKFRSALTMSTFQSAFSVISSLLYILATRKQGQSLSSALGLEPTHVKSKAVAPFRDEKQTNGNGVLNSEKNKAGHANGFSNGTSNGNGASATALTHPTPLEGQAMRKALLYRYFQCAVSVTASAPFGFAALNHVSYPAMVLAKSCKLIPVMLMNVLLYRRKFAPHKYLVVSMVTAGITMFMGFGESDKGGGKHSGGAGGSSMIGITYLLINLAIDGATNSTQDEIFDKYTVTGQQMMFWINVMSTIITSLLIVLPLPFIPVLHPSYGWKSELSTVLAFIREHQGVLSPLMQFAFTGSLGQLFIFETLQHFGSLTLVTITLTRKLFTMVLSVIVYNHKLTLGQWAGAAVVFAGISVEAWVKRRDVHAKSVIQEKEKAEIKSL